MRESQNPMDLDDIVAQLQRSPSAEAVQEIALRTLEALSQAVEQAEQDRDFAAVKRWASDAERLCLEAAEHPLLDPQLRQAFVTASTYWGIRAIYQSARPSTPQKEQASPTAKRWQAEPRVSAPRSTGPVGSEQEYRQPAKEGGGRTGDSMSAKQSRKRQPGQSFTLRRALPGSSRSARLRRSLAQQRAAARRKGNSR